MFPRRQDRLRSAVTRLSKILSSTLSSESGSKRALLPGLFSSKSNTAAAMMMKPTSKTSRPTFSTTAALFSPSSVTRNLLGLSSRLDRTRYVEVVELLPASIQTSQKKLLRGDFFLRSNLTPFSRSTDDVEFRCRRVPFFRFPLNYSAFLLSYQTYY